ncbi:MAG: MerR family transcriptional regulator [Gammaproteobacteria bacterium]|nr:MerR family transcriptional regulator [Gammaproteobacteria bacterium]
MNFLTTSAAARRAGIHRVTLDRWAREGLVQPHRASNGAALYTEAQISEIRGLARDRKAAWRPDKP